MNEKFYLFLWDKGAEITIKYLEAYKCYEPTDLFEMMERGMRAKFKIMEKYPHMAALDPADFVPELDLKMMYREMYWASEGYLWEMLQRGELDTVQMEKNFERLLAFWKAIYKNKEKTV